MLIVVIQKKVKKEVELEERKEGLEEDKFISY